MKIENTETLKTYKAESITKLIYSKDDITISNDVLADIIISYIKYYVVESTLIDAKYKKDFILMLSIEKNSIDFKKFISNCLSPLSLITGDINYKKQFIANQIGIISNYITTEYCNFMIIQYEDYNKRNRYSNDIIMEEIVKAMSYIFGLEVEI